MVEASNGGTHSGS